MKFGGRDLALFAGAYGEEEMNATFNSLKELAALYQGPKDMNQVALDYQENPEDAILLSHAYCTNIGYIFTQTDKFFNLDSDSMASFVLEEIHRSMMAYEPGKGASWLTLFGRFLTNRLRAETQALNCDKRKSNNMVESFDGAFEFDEEESSNKDLSGLIGYEEEAFNEIELLMSLAEKEEITENEYKYCEIILKEVKSPTSINDSEIAEKLQVSSAAVHYMKKKLRNKIGYATASNRYVLSI